MTFNYGLKQAQNFIFVGTNCGAGAGAAVSGGVLAWCAQSPRFKSQHHQNKETRTELRKKLK